MKAWHFVLKVAHYRTGEHIGYKCGTVVAPDLDAAKEVVEREFPGDGFYGLELFEVTGKILYDSFKR